MFSFQITTPGVTNISIYIQITELAFPRQRSSWKEMKVQYFHRKIVKKYLLRKLKAFQNVIWTTPWSKRCLHHYTELLLEMLEGDQLDQKDRESRSLEIAVWNFAAGRRRKTSCHLAWRDWDSSRQWSCPWPSAWDRPPLGWGSFLEPDFLIPL